MSAPTPGPGGPPRPGGRPLVEGTASWLSRVVALFIDWFASYAVAYVVLHDVQAQAFQWVTLGIFLLESTIGVALTGASFGQLLCRIRVHRVDNRPLSLGSALLRQALVCLVIPPLVFRGDGRGLHDILTESAAYRLG